MAKIIEKINKYFPEETKQENKYQRKTQMTSENEIALAIALAYLKKG